MPGAQGLQHLVSGFLPYPDCRGDMIPQKIDPVLEHDQSGFVPVDLQPELPIRLEENLVIASRLL